MNNILVLALFVILYNPFPVEGINKIAVSITRQINSNEHFIKAIGAGIERSVCKNNTNNSTYTVSFIPYNVVGYNESPVDKNPQIKSVQLIFGPLLFYNPTFYGYKPNEPKYKFPTDQSQIFEMDEVTRYKVILKTVEEINKADSNKTLFLITDYSKRKSDKPWEKYNDYVELADYVGTLRIATFKSNRDLDWITETILKERLKNIAIDMTWSNLKILLDKFSQQNILSWRYRIMIFFSGFSKLYSKANINLPFTQNFTVIDFVDSCESSYQNNVSIENEQSYYINDVAFSINTLMGYEYCGKLPAGQVELATGNINYSGGVMTRVNWILHVFRNIPPFKVVGRIIVAEPSKTITVKIPPVPQKSFKTEDILKSMRSKKFRIVALVEKPFVYVDANLTLNASRPGYSIEMIQEIMRNIGVTYEITYVRYPHGIIKNGKLNGVIGMVESQKADVAIGPITYLAQYQDYIDYTIPYKPYKMAIVYKEIQIGIYEAMFNFIVAFDWKVWLMIVGSCVVYACGLTLINLISANRARFNFLDSFLFTVGSAVQGVTTSLPDKISGQILVIFWWIFNLIVVLAYVANYGALRTSFRLQASINTLFDLNQQYTYSYSTLRDSAVDQFIQSSSFSGVQRLGRIMRSEFENLFKFSLDETMKIVRSEQKHAFIYEDVILETFKGEKCLIVTNGFDQFFYAFALMKNSEYTALFNEQINRLQNNGFLDNLEKRYNTTTTPEPCLPSNWLGDIFAFLSNEFVPNNPDSLRVEQISGIFIIMLFGIILSLLITFVEILIRFLTQRKNSDE